MKALALLLSLALGACVATVEQREPVSPPLPVAMPADGSIYQQATAIALFEDTKARRVGDVLTILLVEKTDAQKQASTSVKKDSSTAIANPMLFGRALSAGGVGVGGFELGSQQDFSGSGGSTQSNKLQGSVSVQVLQVLANGNLVVRGQKSIELNQGSELVSVEGIVRPADIGPSNTVTSDRIADAHIRYAGKGAVADASVMGWLSRFFISALWPF